MKKMLLMILAVQANLGAALSWDALPQAVAAAPAVQAGEAEAGAARARQASATRSFAPRLQAFGAGRSEAYTPASLSEDGTWAEAGVRGSANLWRGGRDAARSLGLAADARAGVARARADEQDLLLRARQAWLEAWQARARQQAYLAALSRTADDLVRVQRQSQAGLVPRSDKLALDVLAAELDQHIFDEGHLADEAEHHVAALLGLEPIAAEGLTQDQALAWPGAPEARTAKRAEQDTLAAELEALRAQTQAVGSDWQPALDLEAQARAGRVGHTLSEAHDWQALAVLSLAWDPAQLHSKERAWTRMQAQAQALRLEARSKADAVVLAELDHALASWLGRRSAVETRLAGTQAYRRVVMEESGRGVRDSRDLAESSQAWLEAELDFVVAQARAWSVWSEREAFEAKP